MNDPFQTQFRPELSLKRRSHSIAQAPMESMESDSNTPFDTSDTGPHGLAALQAAWDKLYRARSILEAEQTHLRDDRIALQGEIDALEGREQALAVREQRVKLVEIQALQAALDKEEAQEEKDSESALSKLTRAPFDMARSVLGKKKEK
jgi:hypothetical protein